MPDSSNPLRFVHITDTHTNPDPRYIKEYARVTPLWTTQALVTAVAALPFKPDFVLHTGDVVYDPDVAAYHTVRDLMQTMGLPVYYLAGNHDDSHALQEVLLNRPEADIQPYLYYEFEAKGVQVVCLDSNGPHDPTRPSGTVTPEQITWLDSICSSEDGRPLVVAVHHNPIKMGTPWLDDWMRMENGDELHQILQKAAHRLRGVFHGHIHQSSMIYEDGVLYVAGASAWCQLFSYPHPDNIRFGAEKDALPGFSVVTITDTRTTVRRHEFPFPISGQ